MSVTTRQIGLQAKGADEHEASRDDVLNTTFTHALVWTAHARLKAISMLCAAVALHSAVRSQNKERNV